MIRKVIKIDENKCNGCGLCADACHEGAIGMAQGKARLLREDHCDGLGDCLPACPTGAISFEEREAAAYNEAAVLASKNVLRNFPIQLKLVPVNAPYFDGADLLIAADCTAYCYGDFHRRFMKDRITVVACPKLDGVNYADKLVQIFAGNNIRSVTVIRMTVPCCGGLPFAVQTAIGQSGKSIPTEVVTISPDGKIVSAC